MKAKIWMAVAFFLNYWIGPGSQPGVLVSSTLLTVPGTVIANLASLGISAQVPSLSDLTLIRDTMRRFRTVFSTPFA